MSKQNPRPQLLREHTIPRGWQRATLVALIYLLVAAMTVAPALAQDAINQGVLSVSAGETLHFGGNFTNNSSGSFTNSGNVYLTANADFQNGVITEPVGGLVIFKDNATAANAAGGSHVNGRVRKIGNDAFTFPTGSGSRLGPVGISAPAGVTDQVDAQYFFANPTTLGAALGSGLAALSSVEYWDVEGAPSVNLTFAWDATSGINTLTSGNLANLRLAGWNGSQWVNLNGTTTGATTTGAITASGITPNSYQAYTLASTTAAPSFASVDKKFSTDGTTFTDNISVAQGGTLTERIYYDNTGSAAGTAASLQATLPAGFTRVAGSTKNCLNPTAGETVCNTAAGMGGAINEGAVWSGQNLTIAPTAGLFGVAVNATSGRLEVGRKRYFNLHECIYSTGSGSNLSTSGNGWGGSFAAGSNASNTADTVAICGGGSSGLNPWTSAVLPLDLLGKRYFNMHECIFSNGAGSNLAMIGNGWGGSFAAGSNASNTVDTVAICGGGSSGLNPWTSAVLPLDLLGQRYFNLHECIYSTGSGQNMATNGNGWGGSFAAGSNASNTADTVAICGPGSSGLNLWTKDVLSFDTLDSARGKGYIEFQMTASSTTGVYPQSASLSGSNFPTQNDAGNITVTVAPSFASVDKKFSTDGTTFSDNVSVAQGGTLTERIYYDNTGNTAGTAASIQATLPAGFTRVAGSTKNCLNPTAGETVCNTAAGMGGAINEGAVWSGQNLTIAPTAGLYGVAVNATSGRLEVGRKRYFNLHECIYSTGSGSNLSTSGNGWGGSFAAGSNASNTADTVAICGGGSSGLNPWTSAVLPLDLLGKRYFNMHECIFSNGAGSNLAMIGNGWGGSFAAGSNASNTADTVAICGGGSSGLNPWTSAVLPLDLQGQRYFNLHECIYSTGSGQNMATNGNGWGGSFAAASNASNTADTVAICGPGSSGLNLWTKDVLSFDTLDTARGKGYIEFQMTASSTTGAYTQNASLSGSNFTTQTDSGNLTVMTAPGDTDGDGVLDAADLDDDNDGILDMVEAKSEHVHGIYNGSGTSLRVFLNNGNGTFATTSIDTSLALEVAGSGTVNEKSFLTDVTGDGRADWVGNYGDPTQVNVFAGQANGSFATTPLQTNFPAEVSGLQPMYEDTFLDDVNGDGALDHVHGIYNGSGTSLRVFLNNGNGTFATTSIDTSLALEVAGSGTVNEKSFLTDVTGDGRADWVGNYGDPTQVNVFAGQANGSFATTPLQTNFPAEVSGLQPMYEDTFLDDVNGDGALDHVHGIYNGSGTSLRVFLNNGNGTFATTSIDTSLALEVAGSGTVNEKSFLTDVTGDGRADWVGNYGDPTQVNVFAGQANGSFATTPLQTNFPAEVSGLQPMYEDTFLARSDPDTDGDGMPDRLDLDSDNDGLNDVREAGGTDADGNGMADGAVNGQGIPVSAGAGLTPPDTDGDTKPDYIDLDSDNDTISDLVEGTPTGYPQPTDVNNDGIADGPDGDGDGIADSADGNDTLFGDSGDLPPANSDGDAKPNYTDPDSNDPADTTGDGNGDDIDDAGNGALDAGPVDGKVDNASDAEGDGIADVIDSNDLLFGGLGSPTADSDGDGVLNSSDLDDDGDGIPDSVEGTGDTDGDGVPNSLDLDSDNDGLNDVREAGGLTDANGDGKADGVDANGDGQIDTAQNSPVDSDGDSKPDYLDLDSDNDTISDLVEGGSGATDANNDGVADGPDADRDGIVDSVDGIDNQFGDQSDAPPTNSDGDAKPNYLDPDSNDPTDSTGNGTTDDIDDAGNGGLDGNGDGKVDNTADTDGDGAPDGSDTQDNAFGGLPTPDLDADGDGKLNSADADDDGDGIPDSVEGSADTDGDGIPNRLDLDSDNDGLNDVREAGGLTDANGDGKADGTDGNNDGVIDTPATNPVDSDGDGKDDYIDLDSDNDTISDLVEGSSAGSLADANNDGVADGPDTDHDGIVDSADGNDALFGDASDPAPTNSDGDAKPNYTDPDSNDPADTTGDGAGDDLDDAGNGALDSGPVDGKVDATTDTDGDGAPDVIDNNDTVFGGLGSPTADPDGDGKPNSSDADDDGDGIPDTVEGSGDKDGDGIPNSLDLDSDNDGINDVREAGGLTDANGDGKADGADGNNDGVIDSPANSPVDSDGDTKPDYLDIDSDNDTISDLAEGGSGATDVNNDGLADGPDADFDGIADSADGNDALFGDASDPAPTNSDGDAKPNYTDPDSDDASDTTGNGVGDDIDGTPNSSLDGNGDGKVDSTTDSDGDGSADVADQEDGLFGGLPVLITAKSLPIKVLLQGAYDTVSGLMRDQLRGLASFPLTSPYGDGAVIAASSVLTANNIVDWVRIELRGTGALSTTVVASQGALLQRDGDVVGVDGVSTLSFSGLAGSSYHVVVKHRNHLGVMTANPVTLSGSTPLVDFTNPATAVFIRTRTVAQKSQSGKMLMWGGDANGDGDVKGAGPGTDPGSVRLAVLGHPGNTSFAANYIAVGYAKADVTLNGQTIGAGSGNEISNVILPNVLTHPGNPTLQNNYIICQQLPEDPCN